NGGRLASPARDVFSHDRITLDDTLLASPQPPPRWRHPKPQGLGTTHPGPDGPAPGFDAPPRHPPRVPLGGRPAVQTEGLLLLANQGALARHLELPATGWLRRYRVRAHGSVTQAALDELRQGATVGGINYGPIEAVLDKTQGSNVWLTLALREGKNREVRNILDRLGLTVNRLIRVAFGPFRLRELAAGGVAPVRRRVLIDQLGPRVARELGCEEEAPQPQPPPHGRQRPRRGKPSRP